MNELPQVVLGRRLASEYCWTSQDRLVKAPSPDHETGNLSLKNMNYVIKTFMGSLCVEVVRGVVVVDVEVVLG